MRDEASVSVLLPRSSRPGPRATALLPLRKIERELARELSGIVGEHVARHIDNV